MRYKTMKLRRAITFMLLFCMMFMNRYVTVYAGLGSGILAQSNKLYKPDISNYSSKNEGIVANGIMLTETTRETYLRKHGYYYDPVTKSMTK